MQWRVLGVLKEVNLVNKARNPRKGFLGSFLGGESGSASVEFVLLAIPLFLPILFFLGQFEQLSHGEIVARSLVRESLRAFVTSENPWSAGSRANQTLLTAAKEEGLKQQEIESLDLKFTCSNFPCISPNSKVHATLKLRLNKSNREVIAEAEEFISPWQYNGIPSAPKVGMSIDVGT